MCVQAGLGWLGRLDCTEYMYIHRWGQYPMVSLPHVVNALDYVEIREMGWRLLWVLGCSCLQVVLSRPRRRIH